MSQDETVVGIVTLPAQGISKHAAAAKMMIDYPDATLRGIQPEPVDGHWVGILEKKALSQYRDDNTDSAPVGAGSSGFDHDIDTIGDDMNPMDDMPDHDDEAEDADLIQELVGGKLDEILDRLTELEDKLGGSGTGGVGGGFRGMGEEVEPDESPLEEDIMDQDRQQLKMKSNVQTVYRDRQKGMTIKQARAELTKEAREHPKFRNYEIVNVDVTPDGSQFEATLAPKQRRRRSR